MNRTIEDRNRTAESTIELTTDEARSGESGQGLRFVLLLSLCLVAAVGIVFAITWT